MIFWINLIEPHARLSLVQIWSKSVQPFLKYSQFYGFAFLVIETIMALHSFINLKKAAYSIILIQV